MSLEHRSESGGTPPQHAEKPRGFFVEGLEKKSAGVRMFTPHTILPTEGSHIGSTGFIQTEPIPAYFQVTDTVPKPYFMGVYADRGEPGNGRERDHSVSLYASGKTHEEAEDRLREGLVAIATGEDNPRKSIRVDRRNAPLREAAQDMFRPAAEQSVAQIYPIHTETETEQAA